MLTENDKPDYIGKTESNKTELYEIFFYISLLILVLFYISILIKHLLKKSKWILTQMKNEKAKRNLSKFAKKIAHSNAEKNTELKKTNGIKTTVGNTGYSSLLLTFHSESPRKFAIFGLRRKILADFHATKP